MEKKQLSLTIGAEVQIRGGSIDCFFRNAIPEVWSSVSRYEPDGSIKVFRGIARWAGYWEESVKEIDDRRVAVKVEYPELNKIEIVQKPAQIKEAIKIEEGILSFPINTKPEEFAFLLIRELKQRTLFITPSLLETGKIIETALNLLGELPRVIGTEKVFKVSVEEEKRISIILWSEGMKEKISPSDFGMIWLCRAEKFPEEQIFEISAYFPAKYRFGATMRPRPTKGQDLLLRLAFGPTIEIREA